MKILVVGQGLAGTVLSYYLTSNNIEHKVLDNHHKTAATKAAAGLINPITGRNYVKSWMIETLLPEARKCYDSLSNILEIALVKEIEIIRTLPDISAENKWIESTSRPGYDAYFESNTGMHSYENLVHKRGRYGLIKKGIQVDISSMISAYRELLMQSNQLIEMEFDFSSFHIENEILLDNEKFDLLIFCEGSQAVNNPYFNYLPFQPAKGQSFNIRIDQKTPQKVLRDNIFLTPQKEHVFWTGGGYEKESSNSLPTEKFKEEWNLKLRRLLKIPYEILSHKAGIRPSVKGRRPLLGRHPKYKHLAIFNGMGTKGTSLAPYFANHLIEYLKNGTSLNPDVDINRFAEQ